MPRSAARPAAYAHRSNRSPRWHQLDEHAQIADLLSYVLDLGEPDRAPQLFGVSRSPTSFVMHVLELDADDPLGDLWSLTAPDGIGHQLEVDQPWSWVIVTCESDTDSYLAVAVSRTGQTVLEVRTPGLATFQSSHRATGLLIEACARLFER